MRPMFGLQIELDNVVRNGLDLFVGNSPQSFFFGRHNLRERFETRNKIDLCLKKCKILINRQNFN